MSMSEIWLIVFVVMLVGELATTALVSVWFCGGALFALVGNMLGLSVTAQLFIFVFSSLVLFILTRPFSKKIFKKDKLKTNVDSIIGKRAVVTEKINNEECSGAIIIEGKVWTARSAEDRIIEPKESVTIQEIQGVKAIVK